MEGQVVAAMATAKGTALRARLIGLMGALQVARVWGSAELARTFAVSARTVRRDVNRLRAMGYPVSGQVGLGGGYRWRGGERVAPLLFDDEEAIAAVRGLVAAIASCDADVDGVTVRALAKLEATTPDRLRVAARAGRAGRYAEAAVLTTVSRTITGGDRLRMRYRMLDGSERPTRVCPYGLVRRADGWCLVGWDDPWVGWWAYRMERVDEARTLFAPSPAWRLRRRLPNGHSPETLLWSVVGEPEGSILLPL